MITLIILTIIIKLAITTIKIITATMILIIMIFDLGAGFWSASEANLHGGWWHARP